MLIQIIEGYKELLRAVLILIIHTISTITGGVEIPDNKFVPPGSIIVTQERADKLPDRIGSPYEKINEVIHVNEKLGKGYEELDIEKIIGEREKAMEQNMLETGMPSSSIQ